MTNKDDGWFHQIIHIFRSVTRSKDEVKTPLSFFFRVVLVLPVIIIPVLVTPGIPPDIKYHTLLIGITAVCALVLVVCGFAWFKPKNLVYGEAGHRAEFKIEYGTEKHVLTHGDLRKIAGEQNPKLLADKTEDGAGETV